MSRLDDLIAQYCPDGVPYYSIGSFANCYPGATPKTSVSSYWEKGTIPWMSSGEVNLGEIFSTEKKITQQAYNSTSTKMVPPNTVVIALAGQGKTRGSVAITRIPLCTNQSLCAIVTYNSVNSQFLLHYLRSCYSELREISSGDGTRGGLNLKMIKSFKVPVPPLPVQEEIVRILDTFSQFATELRSKLQAELHARKAQYESIKDSYLDLESSSPLRKLGDICEIKGRIGFRGYTQKDFVNEGEGAISLSPGNICENHLFFDNCKYVTWEKYEESPEIMVSESDIILCKTGSTVGKVAVVENLPEKATINPQLTVLKNIKCNHRYLFYQLSKTSVQQTIKSLAGVGSVPNISQKAIGNIIIPVPTIEEQNRIVKQLDHFDVLYNRISYGLDREIDDRQMQYEYYREKLLTFKEA